MDTTLSEEEVMVRETARKFLETQCPTKLVREMEKDATGYPPALWRQAADLGWQGLALPEQYGGSAMPLTYLGLVLEEVGRALAPLPLHSTVVAALTIARDANEELRSAVLPGVVSGPRICPIRLQPLSIKWVVAISPTSTSSTPTNGALSGRSRSNKTYGTPRSSSR